MYRRANRSEHRSVEVGYQLCTLRTDDCDVFRSCHNSEDSNVVRERRIPTEGRVPVPVDDNWPCDR